MELHIHLNYINSNRYKNTLLIHFRYNLSHLNFSTFSKLGCHLALVCFYGNLNCFHISCFV